MFIDRGRIVFNRSMEDVESRYVEVHGESRSSCGGTRAASRSYERQVLGRSILLFEGVDRQQLATLGEVRTPSLADLFVAVMSNQAGRAEGAAR